MEYIKDIKEIIAEVLEIEDNVLSKITELTSLFQYGLDSMNALMLVVRIEEKYNVIINEEDLFVDNISTIYQINNLIKKYTREINNDL